MILGEEYPCSMNCFYMSWIFFLSSHPKFIWSPGNVISVSVLAKQRFLCRFVQQSTIYQTLPSITFFHLYSLHWKMTLNLHSAFLFLLGIFFPPMAWSSLVCESDCVKVKFMFNCLAESEEQGGLGVRTIHGLMECNHYKVQYFSTWYFLFKRHKGCWIQ